MVGYSRGYSTSIRRIAPERRYGKFHLTDGKVGSSTRHESVSCNIAAILASAYLRVLSFSIPVLRLVSTTLRHPPSCKRVCLSRRAGVPLIQPDWAKSGGPQFYYTNCKRCRGSLVYRMFDQETWMQMLYSWTTSILSFFVMDKINVVCSRGPCILVCIYCTFQSQFSLLRVLINTFKLTI